tara:strand:+ start:5536 stop:5895 length:360 start_codon:yes stop_codon:yes gene_type:complete
MDRSRNAGGGLTGLHLLLDGQTDWCLTGQNLSDYLTAVASGIDVTIVAGPSVIAYAGRMEAWCIIAVSHITVTTLAGQLEIDVFSCSSFDEKIPIALAKKLLGMKAGYTARKIPRAGVG